MDVEASNTYEVWHKKASNDFALFLKTGSTFRPTLVTTPTQRTLSHSPSPQDEFTERPNPNKFEVGMEIKNREELPYLLHKPGNCLLLPAAQTFKPKWPG